MKIIELTLEDVPDAGITAISLVKRPAIEKNFIKFNSNDLDLFSKKEYKFEVIDEEKRILLGPIMIPNKQIYRVHPETGEEFFVYFTETTIRRLAEKYLLEGKLTNSTLEHEQTLNGVSIVENWIVEDPEKDKSNLYGFSLPVGSWCVSMKILNDDIWQKVKNEELLGFSVEGIFNNEIIKQSKNMENLVNEITSKLNEMFDIKPKKEPQKFNEVAATAVIDESPVTIEYEGDSLEAGTALYYEVEGQKVPLPTGEYALESGQILVVAEEGILAEVKEKPAEPKDEPEAMTHEGVVKAVVEALETVMGTFSADLKKEFDDKIEAVKEEFSKPATKPIVPAPKVTPKEPVHLSLNQKIRELNK